MPENRRSAMRQWNSYELLRVAGGYWASCALHAAVRLDVFSLLHDEERSLARLAEACGCDERGMDLLTTALCAMDLMRREGDICAAAPFARRRLCRQSPEYMGSVIGHHHGLLPGWSRLEEAVRLGRPVRDNSSHAEDAERERFLLAMHDIAAAQAARSVPHIDLSGRGALLDLCGGPGSYAVYFCRSNPGLRATVFDLPSTEPVAAGVIERNGMRERIDFWGGDVMRDPLPEGCDAVWISQVLHAFGPRDAAAIVKKALCAAAPGALILIQEFIVDDDRNGPEFAALFGLNMLVGTEGGRSYTGKELTDMLVGAGATAVRRLDVDLPQDCGIIQGVKP